MMFLLYLYFVVSVLSSVMCLMFSVCDHSLYKEFGVLEDKKDAKKWLRYSALCWLWPLVLLSALVVGMVFGLVVLVLEIADIVRSD